VIGRVSVFVPGRPRPKGSWKPIKTKGKTRLVPDNKRSKPWEDLVRVHARVASPSKPWAKDIPVALELDFVFARPKKHFRIRGGKIDRTLLKPKVPAYPIGFKNWPDIDKLERTVLDALSGVVYVDDTQVVRVRKGKTFDCEREGLLITAIPLDPCVGGLDP